MSVNLLFCILYYITDKTTNILIATHSFIYSQS